MSEHLMPTRDWQVGALEVLAELVDASPPALDWTLTQTGELHGEASGYLRVDAGHPGHLASAACVSAVQRWAAWLDAEPTFHGHWLTATTTWRGVTVRVQTWTEEAGSD